MALIRRLSGVIASVMMLFLPLFACAEDIDVFVGGNGGSGGKPNILIVLDNTSNWSRQSQQWDGGVTQGQSEVRAIKTALAGLVDKVNVGLMEFTTQGSANQDGGFVRFDLQPLTATTQASFNGELDEIFSGIETPLEKRNSGTPYGNLMYDVYNYLADTYQSFSGAGTPATADVAGYESQYSKFDSPLDAEDACVKTYVIFIGNPNQSGPSTDSSENSAALASLYEALDLDDVSADGLAGPVGTSNPLPIPLFSTVEKPVTRVVPAGTVDSYVTTEKNNKCYVSAASCTAAQSCPTGATCACVNTPAPVAAGCNAGRYNYTVEVTATVDTVVNDTETEVLPTGQSDTSKGVSWNLDDWAKFLFIHGVPITAEVEQTVDGVTTTTPMTMRMPVVTYTIDVFNKQQNADHTGLMLSTANVGGGKYFVAKNEQAIVDAINKAASEILSASSTFAAVALPLSANNQAQNENQVFIGMFRPDGDAAPRWFGNLKRYQVGILNGQAELVDVNLESAINSLTNFPSECSQSFWSADSGTYWADKNVNPPPLSKCFAATNSPWSDAPDGPFVEKGGAAQALRNLGAAITTRNVLTVDGDALTAFDSDFVDDVGGQAVFDYIRGQETVNQVTDGVETSVTRVRHTAHGDVVHSRPLPINYGVVADQTTPNVAVYYGTNDGLLRAIDSSTGQERWSLVAPEHFGKLQRLAVNEPLVAFANQDMSAMPTPLPKDYFFDGAIGSYVVYEGNAVETAYIYPTMRRGGRMVYALDVTDPDEPELMWRKGCPLPDSDEDCDEGFEDIGQTWSMPVAAHLKGYDEGNSPVVIFGGGYDSCEDADAKEANCPDTAKGRAIYVVDAEDGTLVKAIPVPGAVTADITLVDINHDGYVDYAYAVDLSGNLSRVNFIDPASGAAIDDADAWEAVTIGYSNDTDNPRKFLHAPSALPFNGKVYLAFGSGNRERPLESNYPYVENIDDRFYVFRDDPADTESYDLNDETVMHDYTESTSCASPGVLGEVNRRGWFMSLSGRGEQVATSSVTIGGMVAFNTYKPGGSTVGMCSRPMGVSSAYLVNLFNASGAIGVDGVCGGQRSVEVGTGMPIAPTIGTVKVKDDPSCTGNDCDGDIITFCIGCEGGLKTTELEPTVDQVRQRTYWSSDIDQ